MNIIILQMDEDFKEGLDSPNYLYNPEVSFSKSYDKIGAEQLFDPGNYESSTSYADMLNKAINWKTLILDEIKESKYILPYPVSCFYHRPFLEEQDLNNKKIKSILSKKSYKKEFFKQPFWGSYLIPHEPIPGLYSCFDDYKKALIKWYDAIHGKIVIKTPYNILEENDFEISENNTDEKLFVSKQKNFLNHQITETLNSDVIMKNPRILKKMNMILDLLYMESLQAELDIPGSNEMIDVTRNFPRRKIKKNVTKMTFSTFLKMIYNKMPVSRYSRHDVIQIFNYVNYLLAENNLTDNLINFIVQNNVCLYKLLLLCSNGFNVNVQIINPYINFFNQNISSNKEILGFLHKVLLQNYLMKIFYIIFPNDSCSLKYYFDNNREQCKFALENNDFSNYFKVWLFDILDENTVGFVYSFIYLLFFYDSNLIIKTFPGEFGLILDKIHQINPKVFKMYQIMSNHDLMKILLIDFINIKTFKSYSPSDFYYYLMMNVLNLNYIPHEINDLKFKHVILIFSLQKNGLVDSLFYSITKYIKHNMFFGVNKWQDDCIKLLMLMLDKIVYFPDKLEKLLNVCSGVLRTLKKCKLFDKFDPKMLILFSSLNHEDVNVRYMAFKCFRAIFFCLGEDFSKLLQIKEYFNEIQKSFQRKEPIFIISIAKLIRKYAIKNSGENQSIFSFSKAIIPIMNLLKNNSISIKSYIESLVKNPNFGYFKKEMISFLNSTKNFPQFLLK